MSQVQKKIFDMLMESQFWPRETMLAFQRNQLTQLLLHARENVPFYKTRLDAVFKKKDAIDWDRWHEIPIVTRADLRDRRAEMLAAKLPPGHGPTKTFTSSGSSGIPVAVEATRLWGHANRAAARRFHELQEISAKPSATISTVTETGEFFRGEYYFKNRGKPSADKANGTRELVLNRNLTESRKLDLLEAKGIAYLFEFPNNAEVLARANLSRENPVKLEVVSCFGQSLTAEQKSLFRESFGARSLGIYSSEEGGLMACHCGDSLHYHLNPEIVFVEILDAEGLPCGFGVPGRVVITPFYSTALPLIRYEQGDTAELQSCTCGSRLPVIGNISGRQDQFMRFPEGIRSATGLRQSLLRENLNALAFQIAQVETFKLEIRFVPADAGNPINPGPVVAHIRQLIHPKLDVVFKPVEKVPLNPGGKHQRIVCELED
jgi:phenylacetate-coenzyme A ligase PaaK-like adenylate-forming protein